MDLFGLFSSTVSFEGLSLSSSTFYRLSPFQYVKTAIVKTAIVIYSALALGFLLYQSPEMQISLIFCFFPQLFP